jgi:hypothetical protein
VRATLSAYVRTKGIVPTENPEGLQFTDTATGSRLEFTIVVESFEQAETRQLITVHADYLFDRDGSLAALASGISPSTDGHTARTPTRGWGAVALGPASERDRPQPTANASGRDYLWPVPWSMARRREATMLINALNATKLRVGALSLPPMDPCAPATVPRAVRFSWAVPIGSTRDVDLLDAAIDAAREAFTGLLPALAHVVIDGYPASIALGGAPVHVRKY